MTKTKETTASQTEAGLNQNQEKFCQLYAGQEQSDKEFFGNGAQCYLEIYGSTDEDTGKSISYMTAVANASRLLTNAKVIVRVNELLEEGGFTDENIDKQHLFLINQHGDLKTKMQAIKEYNALRSRVTKNVKLSGGLSLTELFDADDEEDEPKK